MYLSIMDEVAARNAMDLMVHLGIIRKQTLGDVCDVRQLHVFIHDLANLELALNELSLGGIVMMGHMVGKPLALRVLIALLARDCTPGCRFMEEDLLGLYDNLCASMDRVQVLRRMQDMKEKTEGECAAMVQNSGKNDNGQSLMKWTHGTNGRWVGSWVYVC